jgi:hypothetical protein
LAGSGKVSTHAAPGAFGQAVAKVVIDNAANLPKLHVKDHFLEPALV